jgi:hypothetical protein
MPAGYSGTPLVQKLGITPGCRIHAVNAPANYRELLDPLPKDITFVETLEPNLDLVHAFAERAADLEATLPNYVASIKGNGAIWVSWPKKASKVPTDITEDVIRKLALATVLVDVKVCAVDDVWSGLKLVIRTAKRPSF